MSTEDLTPGPGEDQKRSEKRAALHDIEALTTARRWAADHGLQQPDDRMLVAYGDLIYDLAYRAGREDAARDIARVADSTRQSLVSTPPEYANEAAYHRTRAQAFERAVDIARGASSLGRSVRGEEHNTERGSE